MERRESLSMDKLRVLLATALPPPDHGGICNWTRVVRREIGERDDLELLFVDTTQRYRPIPRMQTLSRLLFGSPKSLSVIYGVYRSMRAKHPDVLHLNLSGSFGVFRDMLILYMAKMFNVCTIAHYHLQKTPAEVTSRLYWRLLCRTMSLADAVVVLDKKSETRVRAALPDKPISVLPTMVEIDVIDELKLKLGAPASAPGPGVKIVFVGFVSPVKGVRELVKACLQLSDQNFKLDIVGNVSDTVLKRELEALANRHGKADWLRFHGGVSHAAALEYILAADILVLPSHAESAPAVIIEAMGCGKPVVSTTTGAIPETLDIGGPQECGICVPPRNVESLADAIRRLILDPDLRHRYGLKARDRAVQFYSVQVGCKKLLNLWRSLPKSKS